MRIIAKSFRMKGPLDDDYILYENGDTIHEYDAHTYPGGQNLKEKLNASELKTEIKERLYNATPEEDKELAKQLLNL
ncbi:hypothetical protein [uncultured Chryseobacterium sp.]|uniref:hypothetical protein n=1 Tax=uncultured Chryseobacterium sp. TaxID=259322 RepID=UPI0025864E13|nr:hypothetical protein [uncultured Chryseobacterium sp.]